MKTKAYSRFLLFLLAGLWLSGCGRKAADPEPAAIGGAADPTGTVAEYEWIAEGTEAGQHRVVRSGDGRISTELFVHWNNREYTIRDELQLDANGLPSSQRISG
ncbi:MAG TPA: hypothetical protein VLB07_09310, partial [Woeseiaceae bacterium]|nr:hypothetical protein [Woeseiaceae bacterium]